MKTERDLVFSELFQMSLVTCLEFRIWFEFAGMLVHCWVTINVRSCPNAQPFGKEHGWLRWAIIFVAEACPTNIEL